MRYETERMPMAVILAAGTGSQAGFEANSGPRSLMSIGGSVILERMIRNCLSCGFSQFVVVLGHRADDVRRFVDKTFRGIRVTYVVNDRYRDTGSGHSLMLAAPLVGTAAFVTLDADVVFDTKILRALVDSDLPNVLCIGRSAAANSGQVKVATDTAMRVSDIGTAIDPSQVAGEAIGIAKFSAVTGPLLFAELKNMMEGQGQTQAGYSVAYARLIGKGLPFHALDITGMKWTALTSCGGFEAANAMFGSPVTTVSRGQQRALDEASTKPPRVS